ncbi:MAG TPA: MauE/DoxX family redox-associated membrane protein [Thermoanaerobaculia bacterium]|nr:MauE/DoxX family redox-associated membrane protein [Thermoanaerobaculia bacterium]
MTWFTHPWLTIRVQIALGAIFVVAALPKIADPPSFAHMIYNYRLIPGPLVNALALVMPWVEILVGLALILGVWRREAAIVAGLLVVVFLAAIGWNLARGHAVDCGCFDLHAAGKSREEQLADMRWVLLRDVGILLMVFQVLAASRKERSGSVR